MKSRILTYIITMTVFAALAMPIWLAAQEQEHANPQPHYSVVALGSLGGTSSFSNGINNKGWVTGGANLAGDQSFHAVLWQRGAKLKDLGSLGGPNSVVAFPVKNDRGLIAGISDTSNTDPLGENFCGFGTGLICLGFLWQHGTMTPLPTLGGNNSYATGVNNRSQVVGFAENSTQDPNCIAPQVLDFEAVIWGPKPGEMHELPPLSGDSSAGAVAINNSGQVVGGSGVCMTPGPTAHAVLWQNGSPTNLGNLGGVLNNIAFAINNQGEIVGLSDLTGDATGHAFLWTEDNGMQDLGTLPGDFSSAAFGINAKSQVVGNSCDQSGNCRAFLWQHGVMTDINTLIPPHSPLFLFLGADINDRGEITGDAFTQNSAEVAFRATPTHDGAVSENISSAQGGEAVPKVILPENVREQRSKRLGFGRLGAGRPH